VCIDGRTEAYPARPGRLPSEARRRARPRPARALAGRAFSPHRSRRQPLSLFIHRPRYKRIRCGRPVCFTRSGRPHHAACLQRQAHSPGYHVAAGTCAPPTAVAWSRSNLAGAAGAANCSARAPCARSSVVLHNLGNQSRPPAAGCGGGRSAVGRLNRARPARRQRRRVPQRPAHATAACLAGGPAAPTLKPDLAESQAGDDQSGGAPAKPGIAKNRCRVRNRRQQQPCTV
jgi:hypothetical protein